MSEVKRYDAGCDYAGEDEMVERIDGDYVKCEDYAEIKAQRDALAAEVSAIREQAEDVYAAGYNHGHLNTVDGIAYAPPVEDEFYHNALQVMLEVETPATDAYLNSLRAEGALSVAERMRKARYVFKDIHHGIVSECADIAVDVAKKLREGEPS